MKAMRFSLRRDAFFITLMFYNRHGPACPGHFYQDGAATGGPDTPGHDDYKNPLRDDYKNPFRNDYKNPFRDDYKNPFRDGGNGTAFSAISASPRPPRLSRPEIGTGRR
jgi:hypothetical protein